MIKPLFLIGIHIFLKYFLEYNNAITHIIPPHQLNAKNNSFWDKLAANLTENAVMFI